MAADAEEVKVLRMLREVGGAMNGERVANLNATVQKLMNEKKRLQTQLDESQGSYSEQNRQSSNELMRVLDHKNKVIEELQRLKGNVDDEFMQFKLDSHAKDSTIKVLKEELAQKQAELDDIANFKRLKDTIEATHATALAEHEKQHEALQQQIEDINRKIEEDERTRNATQRKELQAKEDAIREEVKVSMQHRYGQMEEDHSRMQKELQFQGYEIEQMLQQNEQLKQNANSAAAQAKETEEINIALMKRFQWYKRQLSKLQKALDASSVTLPELSEYDGDGTSIIRDDITLSTLRSVSASRAAGSPTRSPNSAPQDLRRRLTTKTNFIVHESVPLARGSVLTPTVEPPLSISGREVVNPTAAAGAVGGDGGEGDGFQEASASLPPTEADLDSVYDDLETVLSDRLKSKQVNASYVHLNNFRVQRAKELEEELKQNSTPSPRKVCGGLGETKVKIARPPVSASPTKEPAPHRASRTPGSTAEVAD